MDDPPSAELLLLIAGLLLTVGTGLFVASEFSLVNLDRADLEARRGRGETMLGPTIRALKTTATHLSSAQLGITLTTLLAGFTLEPAFSGYLAPPLASLGLPRAAVPVVSTVLAVAIATLLSMIIGELVPKNFALALPRQIAKIVMPFQIAFTTVFRPFVWLLNSTANLILRAVGIEPKEELSSARTADELKSLLRHSATRESLARETATLLGRTLAFSDHSAADVMTPRPRVTAVERTATAEDVIALARRTGFSRFPVMDEDIDDLTGIVHVKQAVSVPVERRAAVPVTSLQSELIEVPESIRLDQLLGKLRGRGYQLARVFDEYGGTAGVVTLEDLVEELVGEVDDEHDRPRAGIGRDTRDGSWVFPGTLRPDELLDRARIQIPEDGPYETVAGWVMTELGRIAEPGDTVEVDGGVFRVERMDGRRIDRVRFTPAPEPDADAARPDAARPDAARPGTRPDRERDRERDADGGAS
ncbi:MAG: HlyC/CorC family transporter [Microbacteriaceae bacterium]|nr:HlyC/CorC family transporter [Microbacteriaceae bacterium]